MLFKLCIFKGIRLKLENIPPSNFFIILAVKSIPVMWQYGESRVEQLMK